MFSQLLTRAGIAVSVAGHVLFLVWVIFFAGSHPFEPRAVEAISVDIVTPDEIPQPAKQEPKPEKETPKPPDHLTLPDMERVKPSEDKSADKSPADKSAVDKSPAEKPPEEKTKPAEPPAKEASTPPPAAAPPPAPPPPPDPPAASKPQAAAPPQPPEQQSSASPTKPAPTPPPTPQAAPTPSPQGAQPSPQTSQQPPQAVPRAEPDITERFGMMFSLPGVPGSSSGSGDFDAEANQAADLAANDIAKLRAHLKSCTPLPKGVAPTDNIQIVLRVSFTPEGRLATEPMLIKGPRPSPKVLALLQGAMSGLQSCQPYTMLPADKYNEWRNVDLTFSPKDFGGG